MNPEDYKRLMREVLDEQRYYADIPNKSKGIKKYTIAANILIGFSLLIFLLTWIIAAYSWLVNGSFPEELVRYTSVLLGMSCCAFCGKAAYEYKVDKDCESKMAKFP